MGYDDEDPVWRLFQAQDQMLRSASKGIQEYLDCLLRQCFNLLSSEQPPPQGNINPYRVLGLEGNEADDVIRTRYRELLRRLHPDTAGVQGTGFLLQLVLAAYRKIGLERGWR